MFKISKLLDVRNEKTTISFVSQEYCKIDGKIDYFKTLSFNVEGNIENNDYSLSFDLNCRPEELLNIELSETVDMKKYIFIGETIFYDKSENRTTIDPYMNIKITRYLKNSFIIYIDFITDDYFSGIIEFNFNLDDYLNQIYNNLKK